jgi:uncharacterized protein YegP (UPF0339 family)
MAGRFEIKRGASGKVNIALKARNGRTILTGQHYADKAGAENGVRSVRENASDDAKFERKQAKDGRPYFVLKAGNGQVIGQSQMYASTRAMENGIASVRRHAAEADLDDQAG